MRSVRAPITPLASASPLPIYSPHQYHNRYAPPPLNALHDPRNLRACRHVTTHHPCHPRAYQPLFPHLSHARFALSHLPLTLRVATCPLPRTPLEGLSRDRVYAAILHGYASRRRRLGPVGSQRQGARGPTVPPPSTSPPLAHHGAARSSPVWLEKRC